MVKATISAVVMAMTCVEDNTFSWVDVKAAACAVVKATMSAVVMARPWSASSGTLYLPPSSVR